MPRRAGVEGRLEQLQRTAQVEVEEDARGAVAGPAASAWPLPLDRGVNDGVGPADECLGRGGIAQAPGQPFDVFQAAFVARGPVPAAQLVAGAAEVADEVAAQKTRGSGDSDQHGIPLRRRVYPKCGGGWARTREWRRIPPVAAFTGGIGQTV